MIIRDARERRGVSQKELAAMIGKKNNTLSQYEKGLRDPSPAVLLQIADVLGCTVDELLRGDAEEKTERTG